MDRGYIKLHRQLLNWEWADSPAHLSVWIHLLLMANWSDEPYNYHGVLLQRGQCVVSRRKLAEKTGLSERQVRTVLADLQTTHQTTHQTSHQFTIVTIENYAFFQGEREKTTQQTTHDASGKRPKIKNKRNKENKRSIYTHAGKSSYGVKDNVYLSTEEYLDVISRYERPDELIDNVSLWLTEHDRKDHHATCLTFARNDKWPKRQEPREIPSSVLDEQEQAAADRAREELMELIRAKGIGGAN